MISKAEFHARPPVGRLRGLRVRALAALAVAVPVLALPSAAAARTITLVGAGSSAAQPYMLELFRGYSHIHRNIRFTYFPDGGNAGVKNVQSGAPYEFAINTRPPEPSDGGTTYVKLFLDALCIAVNHNNSITNISLTNLKDIFLGDDTSWNDVPGSNLTTTIAPIGRNAAAGQYTFFQQSVLNGESQALNVQQDTSDGLVQVGIEQNPEAIGYVGLAHSGPPVKKLTVNHVACSAPSIRSESYPLFRYDWGVFPTAHPTVQVLQFFSWVRTSAAAGKIINEAGAVAAFNK
ncbi:MAG: PstS family phosphate ABC transporter substrate-binding protein [Solirubrobacteraceae bacterium]